MVDISVTPPSSLTPVTLPGAGRRVDYLGGRRSTYSRTRWAVASSAGKKDSIDNSLDVTSTAVPKVAMVLMNVSSPDAERSRSGTAISCAPFEPASGPG